MSKDDLYLKLNYDSKERVTKVPDKKKLQNKPTNPVAPKDNKQESLSKYTPSKVPWQLERINPEFTIVERIPIKFKPAGILVLDVDETLLNYKNATLINKEKIKKLIRTAFQNGYLIVIATARGYEVESKSKVAICNVINEIGSMFVNEVYFTSNKCKLSVLKELHSRFYPNELHTHNKIALVDDQDRFLDPCGDANFHTIKVDATGSYLFEIEEFINRFAPHKVSNSISKDDMFLFFKRSEYHPEPLDLQPQIDAKDRGLDILNMW